MFSNHSHHHHKETSTLRLVITIILNFVITIAEIIGGIISGSLSLISDALHNFSDGIAVIISYIAIRYNKKPKDYQFTFGYKRAEILAAVFNSAVLIGISIYLFFEAYERFTEPQPIEGGLMIIVASIGLAANIIGALLLRSGANSNINIKSAYLHLFSDAVSSLAVITGGIFIYFYEIYWIDPILTVLISIYIIKESYLIVRDSMQVLMMAAPQNISIDKLEKEITKIEGVKNIHHVHLWSINDRDNYFEAHIEVENILVSETEIIIEKIENMLREKFKINHVTIQVECDRCNEKKLV